MFKNNKPACNEAGVDENGGFLYLCLDGRQTAEALRKVAEEHREHIKQRRASGKTVTVIVDASRLDGSDIDVAVRSELRLMTLNDVDIVAIVARGTILNIFMSFTPATPTNGKVQFFRTYSQAARWIREVEHEGWTRPVAALVGSLLIGAIGILGLIGWATNNQLLKAFLLDQRPINPVAAAGLLNVALIFYAYYRGWFKLHNVAGIMSILLGVLALGPFPIDTLLFSQKVISAGAHTQIADSAALCFIAVGVCALISTTNRLRLRVLGYIAIFTIISLTLFNIYGQLYAHDFIYNISTSFVMAFNLALAFVVAAVVGTLLVFKKHQVPLLSKISPVGWLILFAIAILQVGGYLYWSQLHHKDSTEVMHAFTVQDTRLKNTIETRIATYTDALLGFQGLFASSNSVSQRDFSTFYNSLNLDHNYPGLRSVVFVASAKTADIPDLVKQYRLDTSLYPAGNPTYTTRQVTDAPIHFFALYVSTNTAITRQYQGIDLTSIPGRQDIYTAALQSNSPHASGTIKFLQVANKPPESGFFIAVPVHPEQLAQPIGVVSANFNYTIFFDKLFGTELTDNNLDVQIKDGSTVIYQSAAFTADSSSHLNSSSVIPIANRQWVMDVTANKAFGVTYEKQRTQVEFLASLVLLTILMILVFVIQSLTRRRALGLAAQMTTDLQSERQNTLEANQKDEAIITSIGDGLIALDRNGIIERNNEVAEHLLGVQKGGLVGHKIASITSAYALDGKKIELADRPYSRVLTMKKPLSQKLYYERTNGTRIPVELNVSPILLNGQVTGVIEVFRDITADIQLDRAKSEFVSLASHQLRTPLSAINWYSEMLLNGDSGQLTKEQSAYVKEIFEGNARMVELVNSLLDVSRLELGKMTLLPEKIDLGEIITSMQNEMRVTVEEKDMHVSTAIDTSISSVVNDRKMVQMIVQNLISNALKYTDPGGKVSITLRKAEGNEIRDAHLIADEKYVLFRVEDNGYGIPASQQKHIFEKMFRADNVRTLDVEGTGLGMYIVKEVVMQMQGWIGFESEEKKGTKVTVIVPVTVKQKTEKRNDT